MQRGKKVTLADLARSTHLLPQTPGTFGTGEDAGMGVWPTPQRLDHSCSDSGHLWGTCGAPGGGLQGLPTALSRAMDGVTGSD